MDPDSKKDLLEDAASLELSTSQQLNSKLQETYELLGEIGSGGMGSIYKARHIVLNQVVAIKRIRDSKVKDEAVIKRFVNEAKAASKLKHENLVTLRDSGVDESGNPYAIMDF